MLCPKCGEHLEDDARFCTNCGQKIETVGRVCAGCGKKLKPDAKFCTSCGLQVGAANTPTVSSKPPLPDSSKKDSGKLVMGIVIAILVVVVVLLGVLVVIPGIKKNGSGDGNGNVAANKEVTEAVVDTTSEVASTEESALTTAQSTITTEAPIDKVVEDDTVTDEISPDDYFIPNSSAEEISESDYSEFSWKDLCYAKNEIYARHGYIFKSEELQQYFGSQPWYKKSKKFTKNPSLSAVELKNVEALKNAELDAGDGSLYPLDGKDQN